MAPSCMGVQCHLQDVQSSSHGLVCYQSKLKTSFVCFFGSRPHGVKSRRFSTSHCLLISLHRFSKTSLVKSDAFNKSPLGLGGFADLLALLVEEPLELPLLWNLLVQPHVKVPQRS